MRITQIPIRRVVRGTDYNRRPFNPYNYPTSPSIEELLSQPTWSVRSLLPPSTDATESPANSSSNTDYSPDTNTNDSASTPEITSSQLRHLLRLSALPLPKSPAHEAKMLQTLHDQIHFVRAIQSVDTTGIEPLITIRDETPEAAAEETITLEKMIPYLELEEKVGRNGTVRRRDVKRTEEEDRRERETWEVDVDALGGSQGRRKGRYFFVKRGKEKKADEKSKEESVDKATQEEGGKTKV